MRGKIRGVVIEVKTRSTTLPLFENPDARKPPLTLVSRNSNLLGGLSAVPWLQIPVRHQRLEPRNRCADADVGPAARRRLRPRDRAAIPFFTPVMHDTVSAYWRVAIGGFLE
jgi:hypothetical protein